MSFSINYRNERDVEIPLLLAFVGQHKPASLLDVGYYSALYAKDVRGIVGKDAVYDGCDVKRDRKVETHLTAYHNGDVRYLDLPMYDMVTCVSVIEHVGGQPIRAVNYEDQQVKFFERLLALAGRWLFVTFPFGQPGFVLGEYNNITDAALDRFLASVGKDDVADVRFYTTQGAQLGNGWVETSRKAASLVTVEPSLGVRCVGILSVERPAPQEQDTPDIPPTVEETEIGGA